MKKKIVLIKLGGSLITKKDTPYTARLEIIAQLSRQIQKVVDEHPETQFILGTGAGSFAHYPVVKHKLKQGIIDSSQKVGFAETHLGTTELNSLVVKQLIRQQVAACSIHPSSIITASNGKVSVACFDALYGYLSLGIIPVVYGDIMFDAEKGCSIFSTEACFDILIQNLLQQNFSVEKVIHLTTVAGVVDNEQKVIPRITRENYKEISTYIFATEGYDVTGGMLHKIETALDYAKKGIQTIIISGEQEQWMKAVSSSAQVGTVIE